MTITITARKWRGGWELWNGDDCWTQVGDLSRARQQVVDYLDTVDEGTDHSGWHFDVIPDIGPLAADVADLPHPSERDEFNRRQVR